MKLGRKRKQEDQDKNAGFPRAESADIGLLLEGTFPYVAGGVSSWVNQMIRGFPDIRFAVVFIGSLEEEYGEAKYELPENIVHFERHYLYEKRRAPEIKKIEGDPATFAVVEEMHRYFRAPHAHAEGRALFERLAPELAGGRLNQEDFLYSHRSWEFIAAQYREFSSDPSFVDYFWTVRTMHAPVWILADIAKNLIPCKAYHTVSTGYAGLLGALLKYRTGKPLILSEHGIYTKERRIDLFNAHWIPDNRVIFQRDPTEIAYFRQMWMRFFEGVGKICYDASDSIIALFEGNRLRQIEDGADPARTSNIPNGIDIARYAPLRTKRPAATPPVMALIGRVVPIKDVMTFVRAMRTVVNRLPQAEAWIIGPEDEDPEYAQECRNLAVGLGISDKVKFLGFQQMTDVLPQVGVVTLSSISEALPLVLLEGFAAGVPAVATDVGACRQLVYGLDAEDQALGAAGSVVQIADPQALAAAAVELLTDPAKWKAASDAGIRRVETYYRQDQMFERYRAVYEANAWQA
ncbi:MAG TPA: GT4 family glycosyltransferase PelF [Burkholderiales bacterium]|nr:GT4 family glycosyltransferase PelF [Burkholderiales bacterium]